MKLKFTLLSLVMLLTFSVFAQTEVSGTVTDENGEALIGVAIAVKGTAKGTLSDLDGSYKLMVPEGYNTIEFSYIGYATTVMEVTGGTMDVVMGEATTTLDEVVISGLATNVKRSNLANAVALIGARELTGITSQPTMEGALYGKLKGADIRSNSGAPGGGMSIKLRGVTSIFGNQQPLYIVDGIYMDNSTISSGTNTVSAAAGGGNTATNQDDASNRISDLVTEDIESIEVLKGASAAAIYGNRAAAGVVIITTKRGKAGKPQLRLSQTTGLMSPIRLLGKREFDRAKIVETFGESEAEKFDANGSTDYEAELYQKNVLSSTTELSYSGGTEKTQYYISGVYKNENGIVDNTGYEKGSFRVNFDHKITDWLDISIGSNYINTTADRGFFNNGNTNTTVGYALAFTYPWEDLFPDENGNYPANNAVGSNVLETVAIATNREEVNRWLNGGQVNFRLYSTDQQNLKLVLSGGRDQYTLRTTSIFPKNISFFRPPTSLGGVSIQGNTVNTNTNGSAFLVHSLYTDSGINFRTQAGLTAQNFEQNTVLSVATGLNGALTSLDQSAAQSITQNSTPQKDRGFFAQEEVNFNDQILATIGIRGDKSSNNGDANKLYFFPKASAAVNFHEFDFWTLEDKIDQFKVRVAYGEAGTFAPFDARFNSLNGTSVSGNSGFITDIQRGNSEIGPERTKELELGTDLAFLQNKISLEFTFYNKDIEDVLLFANVPTSTGYSRQVVNGASLNNKGMEISLGLRPVEGDLTWISQFNWWTNTSEVTELRVPAFNLGGFAASLGQYRIEEGSSATQIVGTINPDNCATDDCSDIDPNGDGFRVYGNAEADFNLSWINQLNWNNWDLNFVWHWKQGGDGVNLSTLLYDLAGLTWDYDDTDLDPTGELGNGDYRTTQWFAGNAGPWIEDASYLRLREVGLFYNIPKEKLGDNLALRVGLSGRNLINVFKYNSYDPEVSNFGGNVLANSIEVTPFPSAKRINLHVTATF